MQLIIIEIEYTYYGFHHTFHTYNSFVKCDFIHFENIDAQRCDYFLTIDERKFLIPKKYQNKLCNISIHY